MTNHWWRGLLARVTLSYAFGSALLSTVVAVSAFTITQDRLVSEAEQIGQDQFFRNGLVVRRDLNTIAEGGDKNEGYRKLLEEDLLRANQSIPLLVVGDEVTGILEIEEVPPELREAVQTEQIAALRHRYVGDDGPETRYTIGVKFDDLDAEYYEVLRLSDLESTTRDLRRILLLSALIASICGAGLGYYSARAALAPVSRVSQAAQAIAAGDFKTRLKDEDDRDLQKLSSSFNEMVDALRTRIEREERFASDVSHELRSPLTTLTASVELLERRKSSLPEIAQKAVTLLREDLTRFERLVEDLLEISKMDAGAVVPQLSHFSIREFLSNVIAQSRHPGIDLQHPKRDLDLVIEADKLRLAQVSTNLIDNAEKYADGATGISYRRVGDCAQIVVEDLGPGVKKEDRTKVFDRFSRSDNQAGNRTAGSGVGLGLSLVAEHVRLHDGRVWVTDRIDGRQGARFVVELPLKHTSEDDQEGHDDFA